MSSVEPFDHLYISRRNQNNRFEVYHFIRGLFHEYHYMHISVLTDLPLSIIRHHLASLASLGVIGHHWASLGVIG